MRGVHVSMRLSLSDVHVLRTLPSDGRLLVVTRIVRRLAYGVLSVVLALYLAQLGLTEQQIGVLLTMTLVGDAGLSLWITTMADRLGRRRMLLVGAGLMVLAGLVFGCTSSFVVLLCAATIGTVSPSGGEVGPFLSIEQAALSQMTSPAQRTQMFAWYNLMGSLATALGALSGGALVHALHAAGRTLLQSYRVVPLVYAGLGVVLGAVIARLSAAVEVAPLDQAPVAHQLGLHRSRRLVFKLSALFMLDAFGTGLVVESLLAYWFHARFGVEPGLLGSLFFGTHILAGGSSLLAARLAARFGLLNTMVFTHLPSNVLLMLVPLMPSLPLAMTVLLLRACLSQMDVPTSQSYTMAVVAPDERSATAGITTVARTAARACAPLVTGTLLEASPVSGPFVLAGGLKILYDLTLYRSFRAVQPPEERPQAMP
jgi:MFS family permease